MISLNSTEQSLENPLWKEQESLGRNTIYFDQVTPDTLFQRVAMIVNFGISEDCRALLFLATGRPEIELSGLVLH